MVKYYVVKVKRKNAEYEESVCIVKGTNKKEVKERYLKWYQKQLASFKLILLDMPKKCEIFVTDIRKCFNEFATEDDIFYIY